MGRGDRKSRRGKIWRGTSGKRRPKKNSSEIVEERKPKKVKAKKPVEAENPKAEKPKLKKKETDKADKKTE